MNDTKTDVPTPATGAEPLPGATGKSCCCAASATGSTSAMTMPTPTPKLAADSGAVALKDPVCGMTVTTRSAHTLEHEGAPVYFCSAGCKTRFAAAPAKYLAKHAGAAPLAGAAAVPEPAVEGAVYTCPMHPEVRQDHPGACPKCGMAL